MMKLAGDSVLHITTTVNKTYAPILKIGVAALASVKDMNLNYLQLS